MTFSTWSGTSTWNKREDKSEQALVPTGGRRQLHVLSKDDLAALIKNPKMFVLVDPVFLLLGICSTEVIAVLPTIYIK